MRRATLVRNLSLVGTSILVNGFTKLTIMGKNNNLRIGILAFHKALVDQPRDPAVVASYCLAIYSDISLSEAMEIAKSNTKQHNSNFQELSAQDKDIAGSKLSQQVMSLAESVKSAAKKMHDRDYLANAMSKYPQAPSSDMVTHIVITLL